MKKTATILMVMLLCTLFSVRAQQPQTAVAEPTQPTQSTGSGESPAVAVVNTPRTEWLGAFDKININGVMQVSLIHIADADTPKIYFDTKGSTTTKFKAEIDKKGVLNVIETVDTKRTILTEVKIYYRDISSLTIAGANVVMEQAYETKMLDVLVSGGASLAAKVDVADLVMEVTGRSSVEIEGSARYLGLKVLTAKFDAFALRTVSTIVDASHGAEVSLCASERFEAVTSTSAKIFYKGEPSIVRTRSIMFGGDILSVGK